MELSICFTFIREKYCEIWKCDYIKIELFHHFWAILNFPYMNLFIFSWMLTSLNFQEIFVFYIISINCWSHPSWIRCDTDYKNIICEDNRIQFYSWCQTKRRIGWDDANPVLVWQWQRPQTCFSMTQLARKQSYDLHRFIDWFPPRKTVKSVLFEGCAEEGRVGFSGLQLQNITQEII